MTFPASWIQIPDRRNGYRITSGWTIPTAISLLPGPSPRVCEGGWKIVDIKTIFGYRSRYVKNNSHRRREKNKMEKWISSFVVSVRLESSEIAWDGNRQHHSCYILDISICECIGFKDLYTEKTDGGGGGRSSPAAHLPFPPRRVDDVRRAGSLDWWYVAGSCNKTRWHEKYQKATDSRAKIKKTFFTLENQRHNGRSRLTGSHVKFLFEFFVLRRWKYKTSPDAGVVAADACRWLTTDGRDDRPVDIG